MIILMRIEKGKEDDHSKSPVVLDDATIWAVTFANPAPIPTVLCIAGALGKRPGCSDLGAMRKSQAKIRRKIFRKIDIGETKILSYNTNSCGIAANDANEAISRREPAIRV